LFCKQKGRDAANDAWRWRHVTDREYPDRPIVGVGAIIISDARVLLVRRAAEPLKGEWSIPGGMLELGETLRVGTEREAREETGLDVRARDVVDVFDSIVPGQRGPAPQFHYVLIDFLCEVVAGDPQPGSDASEVRWFHREDLTSLGLREMTMRAIDKGFSMAQRTP
jgi:ADP-ribose pyrophosphatase YjhB (NUDIX family)